MTSNPKQFEVVRTVPDAEENVYRLDGGKCLSCGMPTMISKDPSRRYCSHKLCNALMVGV